MYFAKLVINISSFLHSLFKSFLSLSQLSPQDRSWQVEISFGQSLLWIFWVICYMMIRGGLWKWKFPSWIKKIISPSVEELCSWYTNTKTWAYNFNYVWTHSYIFPTIHALHTFCLVLCPFLILRRKLIYWLSLVVYPASDKYSQLFTKIFH